jgi:Protein of unknown function (DUF1761)
MSINFLAVLVATVVFYAFGAIYYGVLSKNWLDALQTTQEDLFKKPLWGGKVAPFIISFFFFLLINIVFAHLIAASKQIMQLDWWRGGLYGLGLWAGFVLPPLIITYLYENKTKKLALINGLFFLIGLIISGIILVIWR